jgi:zinc protease
VAISRSDPDYFPLLVGNAILGGAASSRLFTNIREKQGFAYDARSAAMPLKDSGAFAVITQVRNEVLAPAIEAVLGEMREIAALDVSAGELDMAKNYLSGVFVIRIETQDGLASQVAGVKLLGLPVDYMEKYTTNVRAVEPADIRAAASKYIDPERASIVVVGDASAIGKELQKFGEVAVVKAEK